MIFISLLVIIAIHLFLLTRIIFFPYPELFVYPYLTVNGLLPYKQILDQHFPGLMFFPVNLHTLGMVTPQIARIWHLVIIAISQLLLFIVAKKLFKSAKLALVANFLYLLWQPFYEGYVLWIDTFLPLLLLPAFYLLLKWQGKKKRYDLFLAGLLLGVALLFKQVMLPLIFFVGIFVWVKTKDIRKTIPFILGVMMPVGLMISYIYRLGVWSDFWYWTYTFNVTTFAEMGRKFPGISEIIKTAPLFGLAVVLFFWRLYKNRESKLVLLGLFLFGSLFFAYARYDFVHLQPALPFAALVIPYFLRKISIKRSIVFVGAYFIISFAFMIYFYPRHWGNIMPFFGEEEKKISQAVIKLTSSEDKVFAFGTMPHIYYLAERLPPGNIFVFQFPWFMKVSEERVLDALISEPPVVVIREKTATVGGINLVLYANRINDFIDENYLGEQRIGEVEIMVKK